MSKAGKSMFGLLNHISRSSDMLLLHSSFWINRGRWITTCVITYNDLFCFCSYSMRKQPKERPAPNNLMVSLFYALSNFPPKSKSAFKRIGTWNANYFMDGVSEWVYSMVGRLLLGLCVRLWIKPWPFCFFWLLFENFICPVLHTPLICTMQVTSMIIMLLIWIF